MVIIHNTDVRNIIDAVDDDNKHIITKYDYTGDLLLPERITSDVHNTTTKVNEEEMNVVDISFRGLY